MDKTGKKRRKPWAVRITTGWIGTTQKYKYLGYYKSQKDAQLALAQHHLNAMDVDAATITFGELFESWIKKKESTLTEANLMAYNNAFRLVNSLYKKKKLKDLKSNHLQDAIDKLDKKASTKKKVKTLMKQMYEYALINDLAVKNYADFVTVNEKQEDSGRIYDKEEIKKVWDLANEGNITAEDIILLLYTGTRISEALSIKMEDVHLDENYIELHGTKTKAADRLVPIHEDIKPIIEKRLKQKYLLQNKTGGKIPYPTFSKRYKTTLETLGYTHIIHDTRKSFVTYMFQFGVPKETIQFIVGHSQEGVTARVYLKSDIHFLIQEVNKLTFE